ncbi:hypothetical protein [Halalkalibaculum sp. DA384]
MVTIWSHAQSTAQATMRVSVKVESSVSATSESKPNLMFAENGVHGEIGTIALTGMDRKQVHIESEKELKLTNTEGDSVTLSVDMANQEDSEHVNIRFSGADQQNGDRGYRGMYSGTLVTTIDYF